MFMILSPLAAAARLNANKKAHFGTMLFYCNPVNIDLHKKLKAVQWTEKGQISVTERTKSKVKRKGAPSP